MEIRNLTCIGCPLGCSITVEMENGEILSVTGNTCKRGDEYARREVTNPTRIVTSTVPVLGGEIAMLPVKTRTDIPKGKIFECISALKQITVHAPVEAGDIILHDVAETGVDIIATKRVSRIAF